MPAANTTATDRKPSPRTPYAVRTPTARAKLTNGTRGMVLPGIDQRSAIARRYRDVICAIIADLGGESRLSEARLQLIRRFSALVVQAETMEAALVDGKPFDSSAHAHISSTLVRLAARVGLNRVPKNVTPSLHDYLESKVAETEVAE
jgi:CRP-like cAMP-binding protein